LAVIGNKWAVSEGKQGFWEQGRQSLGGGAKGRIRGKKHDFWLDWVSLKRSDYEWV
jgi:hypothetical protein